MSSTQTPNWTLEPYILQSLLLLLAPAFFAASIYMELGRIITLVDGEHLSMIRKQRLTKIFVCGDVFSFLVQGAGQFLPLPGSHTLLTHHQVVESWPARQPLLLRSARRS